MKSVVMTGATGAVGTALVRACIEKGVRVLVLAREGSARNENIPNHPLVEVRFCDLSELAALQARDGERYDAFYHFAWAGTTGAARNDFYLQNQNVRYALDAVGAAKRLGCSVFVGAGSQAEYGRFEGALTPETPTYPENGYGIAKLCAGAMTREAAHAAGMRHVWMRILSVYGPFDGAGSMVMSTVSKLKAGVSPQFTKGEQLWDYLYSDDAAEAFFRAAERGKDGKVYVLGSGKAIPLRRYVEMIRDAAAPDFPLTFGEIPYAERQVMHLEADISALTADTGFIPQYTFEAGIRALLKTL